MPHTQTNGNVDSIPSTLNISDIESKELHNTCGSTSDLVTKAIDYVLSMKAKPGTVYWLGNEQLSDTNLVSKELSNNIFYDFCHNNNAIGALDILQLLSDRTIPSEIVNNFLLARSFSSDELVMIRNRYYNDMSDESKIILDEYSHLEFEHETSQIFETETVI